ncbi:MAG: ATP-binding cassette domain-containing protein [Acidobacteria bacterium]|nr:ATP-binding cassette domain-containing protein [Acidobacteriota bacterium]
MSVVRFEHVAKSLPHGFWLRRKDVLRDVSLSIEPGEVYGFLGPNGAGKTTSLKCLLGLLKPDSGSVEILGRPGSDPAARERLGYLPEHPYFYPHLTGRELVDYFGRLFSLPADVRVRRRDELIERVGMSDRADQPIKQYSKGMLQRIGLAQALINDPELVVLDEPMSGLDPVGRREVKDIILDLKAKGTTVFFSSHILADAETLCDRVGLLFDGRIVLESGVDELLEGRVEYWDATCDDVSPDKLPGYQSRATQGGRLYFRIPSAEQLDAWIDAVRGAGGRVVQVSPHRHTLEDYFIGAVRGERSSDEGAELEESA